MDNRDITALAIRQASYDLSNMIKGQEMSDSKLEEIINNLQDISSIEPPVELLTTPEEQARYAIQYQGALRELKEAMYQTSSYQMEDARAYMKIKSEAYPMAIRDFNEKMDAFHLDTTQSYGSQLKELTLDPAKLNGKEALFQKIYKENYNQCLSKVTYNLAVDCAQKAAAHDCNEKAGAAYQQLSEREKGHYEFLRPFKAKYEAIVIAQAKEDAMEAAEHYAQQDYETANEKLHEKIEQAFPNMNGDSPYENAFRAEYMSKYKILYNRYQVENGDHKKEDELARFFEELQGIGKKPEKKSRFSKIRQKSTDAAKKVKLPKSAKGILKRFKSYGVHQLFDIEDVPGSLSLVALHNPYRENYYSPEERQRCHDILVAYEDILKLLGLSHFRERDGKRSYLTIDDVLDIKGITEQQREELQQAKKDCVVLEMKSHKVKTADELTGKIAEIEGLMSGIMNEMQFIQEATVALHDYENRRKEMEKSNKLSVATKNSANSLSLMLTEAIYKRDAELIKERMGFCQDYIEIMEQEIKMAEVKENTQEVPVEAKEIESQSVIHEEEEPTIDEPTIQENLSETSIEPESSEKEPENTALSLEQRVSELEDELKRVKEEKDQYYNRYYSLVKIHDKQSVLYHQKSSDLKKKTKSLRSAKAAKKRVSIELDRAIKEKKAATSALDKLSKEIKKMKENQNRMIREAVREAQKELLNNVQTDIKNKAETNSYNAEADFLEGYRTFKSYTPEQLEYFVNNGGAQAMREEIEKLPNLGASENLRQELLKELHHLQNKTNLSGVQMIKK